MRNSLVKLPTGSTRTKRHFIDVFRLIPILSCPAFLARFRQQLNQVSNSTTNPPSLLDKPLSLISHFSSGHHGIFTGGTAAGSGKWSPGADIIRLKVSQDLRSFMFPGCSVENMLKGLCLLAAGRCFQQHFGSMVHG